MTSSYQTNEEVNNLKMMRPHVVVLGAGASRAACPNGDKNGRKLPLMDDLVSVLNLNSTLNEWGINPQSNFENIFSMLYEKNEYEKLKVIECVVKEYFMQLCLPNTPTLYDHLVLSLTKKDLIASFNWDPLLLHAYLRNRNSGLTLPQLVFLHGNIAVGFCKSHKRYGTFGTDCPICGKPLKRMKLLYPIKEKNYTNDILIQNFWNMFKNNLKNAFMVTIFGYSAPKTDTKAICTMEEIFKMKKTRQLDEIMFVSNQNNDAVYANWKSFIYTHHYEVYNNFYDSFLANHPRQTGEAYGARYLEAEFIESNPIPRNFDFPRLWSWFEKFKNVEE